MQTLLYSENVKTLEHTNSLKDRGKRRDKMSLPVLKKSSDKEEWK